MIRRRKRKYDDPLRHACHPRPRSRREFLSQGFITGSALAVGSGLTTFGGKSFALSPPLASLLDGCDIQTQGAGKIPFICFDLAGGSNQAGSNVLVGRQGGQRDFLSTAGYERQGLPGDMVPSIVNPDTQTNDFVDEPLGLAFHSDSAFLRGMMTRITPATAANINGAVIPARSENDTGNNPHNPMYGIAKAGADGQLLTLIGSENSAGYKMHYAAPNTAIIALNSPSTGDYIAWSGAVDSVFRGTLGATYLEVARNNDAKRITYFTPRFAGFQLGVSYAHDGVQDNFGPTNIAGGSGTLGHIFDIGANYVQSFGDINVAIIADKAH